MAAARPPRTQLALAVIGAVLATLVTGALNTSPTTRLIGAGVGAAIPVLVTMGGAQGMMLSVLITGGAFFINYGGFTVFDYAADKEATFPIPDAMPAPGPPPPPPPPPPTDGNGHIVTTENGLSMEVSPERVHCDSEGCDNEVTVTSTGNELLKITSIEFDGEAADEFDYSGNCEDESPLGKDESCRIEISFMPSGGAGTRNVNLVVHQNFVGDPTMVPVEGEGGGPPPPSPGDLVAMRGGIRCSYVLGGVNGEPRDTVQISFLLRFLNAPDGPQSVFVSARGTLGPTGPTPGRREGRRDVALAPRPSAYGRRHVVIVSVDPSNEVPESNEDNNRLGVRVDLPAAPVAPRPLSCRPG